MFKVVVSPEMFSRAESQFQILKQLQPPRDAVLGIAEYALKMNDGGRVVIQGQPMSVTAYRDQIGQCYRALFQTKRGVVEYLVEAAHKSHRVPWHITVSLCTHDRAFSIRQQLLADGLLIPANQRSIAA